MSVDEIRTFVIENGCMPEGISIVGGLSAEDFPEYAPVYSSGKVCGIADISKIYVKS